jgi:2-phospho-L-lactate guanylyltransferase (CobY/MobA/RfbA family)
LFALELGDRSYPVLARIHIILGVKHPMLTLDQLISEATALPDGAKAILLDKLMESMTGQIDRDALNEGIQKAQDRIADVDSGTVQTIPGDIALAQVRQLLGK